MGQLMDQIVSRGNMRLAYQKVKANKGASGVDGISIEEIDTYERAKRSECNVVQLRLITN